MGKDMGYDRERLLEQYPRTFEVPFDSEKKYMISVHRDSGHETVYVKGACDYLLEKCSYVQIGDRQELMTQARKMKIRLAMEQMAKEGLRILALAYRERVEEKTESGLMRGLVFAGMAGMIDPPERKPPPLSRS